MAMVKPAGIRSRNRTANMTPMPETPSRGPLMVPPPRPVASVRGIVQQTGQRQEGEARRHAEDEGIVDDLQGLGHLAGGHDPRPPDG